MTTKVKSKNSPKTVWIGTVDGIFGYGMAVVGESREECYKALKKEYNSCAKGTYDDYPIEYDENGKKMTRFEKAMENWGMCISEVRIGKVYDDGFRE